MSKIDTSRKNNKKSLWGFLAFIATLTFFVLLEASGLFGFIIALLAWYGTYKYLDNKEGKKAKTHKNIVNNKNQEKTEPEEYRQGELIRGVPRKGTEARRIYEEAEKRKKLVKQKGVDVLITELYFNFMKYYPSWIKKSEEKNIGALSIVSKASESEEGEKKTTELIVNGNEYKFIFEETPFTDPIGNDTLHGLLELFAQDKKVLALNVAYEDPGGYSWGSWHSFGVKAFIDGDWINDFQELKRLDKEAEKQRATEEAEDPEKIEKLKKDFGIE